MSDTSKASLIELAAIADGNMSSLGDMLKSNTINPTDLEDTSVDSLLIVIAVLTKLQSTGSLSGRSQLFKAHRLLGELVADVENGISS